MLSWQTGDSKECSCTRGDRSECHR